MYRGLYADMSWLYQRQLEYGKVETLDGQKNRFQAGSNSVNQILETSCLMMMGR